MVKILSHLQYDVINLGEKDLQLGPRRLIALRQKFSAPFLSANVFDRVREKPLVAPFRIKKFSGLNVGIFGLIDEKLAPRLVDSLRIESADSAARRIVAQLRNRCDLIILLSHLNYNRSLNLAREVDGIDVIISGHAAFREKAVRKIRETLVIQIRHFGQSVGDLLLHLKDRKISYFEDFTRTLDASVAPDSTIQALVQLCEHRKGMQTVSTRSPKKSVRTIGYYIQAKRCRTCHAKIYHQWQQTAHARAFGRLSGKQREDRNCLSCHTTGFEISNGFRNLNTNPGLANVQCETCHGPRFQHVRNFEAIDSQKNARITANPDTKTTVNPEICRECHTRERDPNFDLQKSLNIVAHRE